MIDVPKNVTTTSTEHQKSSKMLDISAYPTENTESEVLTVNAYAEMIHCKFPVEMLNSLRRVGRAMVIALRFARSRNMAEHLNATSISNARFVKLYISSTLNFYPFVVCWSLSIFWCDKLWEKDALRDKLTPLLKRAKHSPVASISLSVTN